MTDRLKRCRTAYLAIRDGDTGNVNIREVKTNNTYGAQTDVADTSTTGSFVGRALFAPSIGHSGWTVYPCSLCAPMGYSPFGWFIQPYTDDSLFCALEPIKVRWL